jgi:hypothetical protein
MLVGNKYHGKEIGDQDEGIRSWGRVLNASLII